MRVRLGGKYWTIFTGRAGASPNTDAEIDHEKNSVLFSPDLVGDKLLETVIHECCHMAFPYLDEDTVDNFGRDLSRVLSRLSAEIEPPLRRPR